MIFWHWRNYTLKIPGFKRNPIDHMTGGFALKGIVEGWGQNEIKCQAGNGLGKKRKFYH